MESITQQPPVDEQTALLSDRYSPKPKRTPLPKLQLAIILLVQVCEIVTSNSILPYINQLIADLGIAGGDNAKLGYYAGLIESLFYVAQAATILQWGRISDRTGRKPILLIGLMGSVLSMLCFGLSRTFVALIISRCLCGVLNGNTGVMKSAMGEVLDTTNRAEGFALLPVVWSVGSSIAPLMGGSLARPKEHFPSYFKSEFWAAYPYFLSCLGPAIFTFITFLITLFYLKETLPKYSRTATSFTTQSAKEVPLRELLTYPVVLSVSNYVTLALMEAMFIYLLPLFLTMPIELGGLGFTPLVIGYAFGALGVWSGLFSVLFCAKLIRRFGEKRVFIAGMLTFCVNSIMLPLINTVARRIGSTWAVWCLLSFSLSLLPLMDTCYSCIFIYITASSPNKNSLGATNGISQTTVSIARAIGPALATSLFSFSVDRNILGGYAVYVVLFALSCAVLLPALQLPVKPWDENDDQLQRNSF